MRPDVSGTQQQTPVAENLRADSAATSNRADA
jgi:hypothetical protein